LLVYVAIKTDDGVSIFFIPTIYLKVGMVISKTNYANKMFMFTKYM